MADIHINDGNNLTTLSSQVEYRGDHTAIISQIVPPNGSPSGNYNITLTGTNLGTDTTKLSVSIDGILCNVVSVSNTIAVCTVQPRPNIPTFNSFDITLSDNPVILQTINFTYVSRWSDPATWGGDIPPIDGDAVVVPKGMVLLVDQSTPSLKSIIVEGSLVFSDERDMIIKAQHIVINHGIFMAGTEEIPYQHQLTF